MKTAIIQNDALKVDTYTVRSSDIGTSEGCILLFSGGLDTSCMLKYIQEKYHIEVTTLICDIGQDEDFKKVEQKANSLGAKEHITYDARQEFIQEYLWKAVMLNALYKEHHPISSSLSRQLITKIATKLAKDRGINIIAHGATGKGNDSFRFDNGILVHSNSKMKVMAPVREWGMGREDELIYAQERNIPVDANKRDSYSIDENMWGREIEAGSLDDLNFQLPERIYKWTNSIENAPEQPGFVEIEFSSGIPQKIIFRDNEGDITIVEDNTEIIKMLNSFAGKHAIGRHDCLEERASGFKVREIHESPAATVLIKAHRLLESSTLTSYEIDVKKILEDTWIKLLVTGHIDPVLNSIESFSKEVNKRVCGKVGFKLLKGNVLPCKLEPNSGIDFKSLISRGFMKELNQKTVPGAIEFTSLGARAAFYNGNGNAK